MAAQSGNALGQNKRFIGVRLSCTCLFHFHSSARSTATSGRASGQKQLTGKVCAPLARRKFDLKARAAGECCCDLCLRGPDSFGVSSLCTMIYGRRKSRAKCRKLPISRIAFGRPLGRLLLRVCLCAAAARRRPRACCATGANLMKCDQTKGLRPCGLARLMGQAKSGGGCGGGGGPKRSIRLAWPAAKQKSKTNERASVAQEQRALLGSGHLGELCLRSL